MNRNSFDNAPPTLQAIAAPLLDHLALEEQWLQAVHAHLATLRRCTAAGNADQLAVALRDQPALAASREHLAEARQTLRLQLAAALEITAERVSLASAASQLPAPLRERVLARRQSLRTHALEVRALSRSTMHFMRQSHDLVQACLTELTGTATEESRYTPAGLPQATLGVGLVELRT